MNRKQFTRELKTKIKHLPKSEQRELVIFYNEMISERMEDGMSEEAAISALGTIDELLMSYTPELPKAQSRSPRLRAWHIVLIVLGSPVWICLLAAFLCLLLAFYIIIWAIVVVFYAVFAAMVSSAVACIMAGIYGMISNGPAGFFAYVGCGALLAGISIFWLMLCNIIAKGMAKLTAKVSKGVFRFFFKKNRKG